MRKMQVRGLEAAQEKLQKDLSLEPQQSVGQLQFAQVVAAAGAAQEALTAELVAKAPSLPPGTSRPFSSTR